MRTLQCLLVASICALVLTQGASASGEAWHDSTRPRGASKEIPREAQKALVCQVLGDWAAFQVTKLVRDDAMQKGAVDPQGEEILRQIRMTESLASIAFEKLAPEVDHDAMYQDAVGKMRVYLTEDGEAADTNAKRMVPVCQQAYRKMASEGALTVDEIQTAKDVSRESVAKLAEELEAEGYSAQQ